ncbi:hypothetical protein [Streptomyces misionensis]|uniref:hypothetical protein n=1 Tax=Streptomyces misionensis TaxID=67331 RepID=UPI0033B46DD7
MTADTARGLATLATYGVLGLLLWNGGMPLAVGGTAVLAIRSGSASINNLALTVADLQEESLFVADLDRLCTEAERQAIPTTGRDVPSSCKEIHFEKVTFTYHGSDQPSLREVDLVCRGRVAMNTVSAVTSGARHRSKPMNPCPPSATNSSPDSSPNATPTTSPSSPCAFPPPGLAALRSPAATIL